MTTAKRNNHRIKSSAEVEGSQAKSIATATPQAIRQVNRSILLNLIRRHQPVSRAELSRITKMHRSNVSFIVEELIAEGFLREERATPVGKGRVPFFLSFRDDNIYVLAANMRFTETTIALGQLNGGIEKQLSFKTPEDPESFVRLLDREIRRLLLTIRPSLRKSVKHLTLSVPGHINSALQHDIWIPSLPGYAGFPLQAAVEDKTGIPTEVMNNASLGALAEMWLTEAQQKTMKGFVFLVIGDVGTGSGLVLDGRLYLGHDRRFAGEIGHTVIDPSGPKCVCGKKGCWQLYVRDRATWERCHSRKPFSSEEFRQFLNDAKQGDKRALAALRETVRYLALGISNIAQMLNPEAVIISGAITEIWDVLEPELRKQLSGLNVLTAVRPSQENMDLLFLKGAIHLGLQKLFQSPLLDSMVGNAQ